MKSQQLTDQNVLDHFGELTKHLCPCEALGMTIQEFRLMTSSMGYDLMLRPKPDDRLFGHRIVIIPESWTYCNG